MAQLYGEEVESLRKERQAAAAAEEEEDRKLELRLGPPVHDVIRESSLSNAAAMARTTQKRSSPAPVVGWPPVRSFRKNIASSSSNKQASLSPKKFRKEENNTKPDIIPVKNNNNNHLFVKIYVEGFPIGRKVNLRAYDSYEKLSLAIDELFGGLLAAAQTKTEESGTVGEDNAVAAAAPGEHTLVYEDHEGDRILVGDVPWNMFVTTAKKLRVLRSSPV